MVNCNTETVSTDYDTSDRLYFEPLTLEDVLEIVEREKPHGVIVQFGGQTPLKLAIPFWKAGVPIIGTSPDAMDHAEDRKRFKDVILALGLNQPPNDIAHSYDEVMEVAKRIGYPLVVRPSYVLGGHAMQIVRNEEDLREYLTSVVKASQPSHSSGWLPHRGCRNRRGRRCRRKNSGYRGNHGTHRGGGYPLR